MPHLNRLWWRVFVVPLLLAAVLLVGAPQRALAQDITDGLVGYWPFDEGSGSTSADVSGSGNTATLHTPNSFTGSPASTDFANPFALGSTHNGSSYATAPGKQYRCAAATDGGFLGAHQRRWAGSRDGSGDAD